jgi:PhnB protein
MHSNLVPYICVAGASDAIEFYKRAFGAKEVMRLAEPGGRIGHAELEINGALLMLSDEHPEMGFLGPKTLGGTATSLNLAVDRVDDVLRNAKELGATIEREAKDEFYGYRTGVLLDPYGHRWMLMTKIAEMSSKEVEERYEELMKGGASA